MNEIPSRYPSNRVIKKVKAERNILLVEVTHKSKVTGREWTELYEIWFDGNGVEIWKFTENGFKFMGKLCDLRWNSYTLKANAREVGIFGGPEDVNEAIEDLKKLANELRKFVEKRGNI